MDPRRITTTRQQNMLALGAGGRPVTLAHVQLKRFLERMLTTDHAALFAEPEVDEARGQVDWYSDRDGTIERFDEADSETQRAVAERLTQLIDEIGTQAAILEQSEVIADRDLGAALRQALQVPSSEHIYSVGGHPVLAGWGHLSAGASPPRDVLLSRIGRITGGPLRPDDGTTAGDADQKTGATGEDTGAGDAVLAGTQKTVHETIIVERHGFDWLAVLTALLILLVFGGIVVVLLRACGLSWPDEQAHPVLNFCPSVAELAPYPAPPEELAIVVKRRQQLEQEIADLRVAVAVEQGQCRVPEPLPIIEPPLPEEPVVEPLEPEETLEPEPETTEPQPEQQTTEAPPEEEPPKSASPG